MNLLASWDGLSPASVIAGGRIVTLFILSVLLMGCQAATPTVSNRALLAHLPGVDFSGLRSMEPLDSVKVTCSLPDRWRALAPNEAAMYTIRQWKSPSGYTGVGIVYAHLPFPVNAKALLWFAKMEYTKKGGDGTALGEWTDSLGRPWFEAENEKYHVRGYAVTDGFSAWIVFSGYKITRPMNTAEMNLASRCIDTVVPYSGEKKPAHAVIADDEDEDDGKPKGAGKG